VKPINDDLRAAIVAVGADACGLLDVDASMFFRLAELGLARFNSSQWELTPDGAKLLPMLMERQ
jgi:hypothetical protein